MNDIPHKCHDETIISLQCGLSFIVVENPFYKNYLPGLDRWDRSGS